MSAVANRYKNNHLDAAMKTEVASFASITPSLTNSSHCVGCGSTIEDPFIVHVQPNLEWHNRCLNCSECNRSLGNDSTCFVRDGKAYCREDYAKTFLYRCSGCHQRIGKADLVFRVRGRTFHADCFHCVVCERSLQPGEEIAIRQNQVCCLLHAHLLVESAASRPCLSPAYPCDEELTSEDPAGQRDDVYLPCFGYTDSSQCQDGAQVVCSTMQQQVWRNPLQATSEHHQLSPNGTGCRKPTSTSSSFAYQMSSNSSMGAVLQESDSPLTVDSATTCEENDDMECNDLEDTDFDDKECITLIHSDGGAGHGQNKFDVRLETPSLIIEENSSGLQGTSQFRSQSSSKSLMLMSNGAIPTTESISRGVCVHGVNDPNSNRNPDTETSNNPSTGNVNVLVSSSSGHAQVAVIKVTKGAGSRRAKDQKTTRVRTVLNEKQLHTLRNCYAANPRPDALMKEQLVEMTNLSPRVIRVWFQNKRCKDKKRQILLKQMEQQQQQQQQSTGRSNIIHGLPLIAGSPVRNDISLLTTSCTAAASIVELHQPTPALPSFSYWKPRSSVCMDQRGPVTRSTTMVSSSSCEFETGLPPPAVPGLQGLIPPPSPPPTLLQGQSQGIKSSGVGVRLSPIVPPYSTASSSALVPVTAMAASSTSPVAQQPAPLSSASLAPPTGHLLPTYSLASAALAYLPPGGVATADMVASRLSNQQQVNVVNLSTVPRPSSAALRESATLDLLQQPPANSVGVLQTEIPIFSSDLLSEQYNDQFSGHDSQTVTSRHGAFQRLMSNFDSSNTHLACMRPPANSINGTGLPPLPKHLDFPCRLLPLPPPDLITSEEPFLFSSPPPMSVMPHGQPTISPHVAEFMYSVSQVSTALPNPQPHMAALASHPLMPHYSIAPGLDGTPASVDMHPEQSISSIPPGHCNMTDGLTVASERRSASRLSTLTTFDQLMPVANPAHHTHDRHILSDRLRKAPSLLEHQNRPSLSA